MTHYRPKDPLREAEREIFRLRALLTSARGELESVRTARDQAQAALEVLGARMAATPDPLAAPDTGSELSVALAGIRLLAGVGTVVGTWLAARGWGVFATVPAFYLVACVGLLVGTIQIRRKGDATRDGAGFGTTAGAGGVEGHQGASQSA